MNLVVFFICSFLSLASFAASKVDSIEDSHHVFVLLEPVHTFEENQRVIILSQSTHELVAFGDINLIITTEDGDYAKIQIYEIIKDSLVKPGDPIVHLNEENVSRYNVPGQFSIALNKEEALSAQYKDLVYLGVFGAEGHTLSKNEWLFSPFMLQYGVSPNVTLKTEPGLYLDGYPNAGTKWRVAKNKHGTITLNSLLSREINRNDWIVQGGFLVSIPSSSKFQTHLALNLIFDGVERENITAEKLKLFKDSDFRTIYEYITDDWDRLLLGPLYNFEQKSIGGTFSYMWIWDSYHLNLGVASKNVVDLEFSTKGYYILADFFWRI